MTAVLIYKSECTKAYSMSEQGEGYSLRPWSNGDSGYYEGDDDGGLWYTLPDGYSIGETVSGEKAIFDANDKHCEIVMHRSGRPQLVSLAREMPVLAECEEPVEA